MADQWRRILAERTARHVLVCQAAVLICRAASSCLPSETATSGTVFAVEERTFQPCKWAGMAVAKVIYRRPHEAGGINIEIILNMNIKPAISFLTKDGQAPFTDKVTTILQQLKHNTNYPTPTPTLPAMTWSGCCSGFPVQKPCSVAQGQGADRQLASYVSASDGFARSGNAPLWVRGNLYPLCEPGPKARTWAKGPKQASPGQRPGCTQSQDQSPEGAAPLVTPLQGFSFSSSSYPGLRSCLACPELACLRTVGAPVGARHHA